MIDTQRFDEEPRFWIDDNPENNIYMARHGIDDLPVDAGYVGLVDEEAGGIVAWGTYTNLVPLVRRLNGWRTVWVVSHYLPGSSGGFNWYPDAESAEVGYHREIAAWENGEDAVRVRLLTIDVPANRSGPDITNYIDARIDEIELTLPAIAEWSHHRLHWLDKLTYEQQWSAYFAWGNSKCHLGEVPTITFDQWVEMERSLTKV